MKKTGSILRSGSKAGLVFALGSALLFAAAPASRAGVGFWPKDYMIFNSNSMGNTYWGDSLGVNYNGRNMGKYWGTNTFVINGAESWTWESDPDWAGEVRMFYRITNSASAVGNFNQVMLNQVWGGWNGPNYDRKWDQTTQNINMLGRPTGMYYVEVYFAVSGHWSGGSWDAAWDSSTPDYKAYYEIVPCPIVTGHIINAGASVYDGQVASGTFQVVHHFRDASGIVTTNGGISFIPNFDLLNPYGKEILTDEVYNAFGRVDNSKTVIGTDVTHAACAMADVWLGTYTTRWSAINSNGIATINSATYSNNGPPLVFAVVDDDTNAPLLGSENLYPNCGYETNGAGYWSWGGPYSFKATAAESGSYGLEVLQTSEGGVYFPYIECLSNTLYIFQARVKRDSAFTNRMVLKAEYYQADHGTIAGSWCEIAFQTNLTTSWTTYSLMCTSPVTLGRYIRPMVIFGYPTGTGNATCMVDNVALYAVPMQAKLDNTNLPAYLPNVLATNAYYDITDGNLANLSATNPLKLIFSAYDYGSGLSRGWNGSTTQMNVDVGAWLTDNVTNYNTESAAIVQTMQRGATSTWKFVNADVTTLFNARTNLISVSVPDADMDRTTDQLWRVNGNAGYLVVNDDDTNAAEVGNLLYNPGFEAGDGAGSTARDGWTVGNADGWWAYGGAEVRWWAKNNGTNGAAWESWAGGYWGGFGQDIFVNIPAGGVVNFNIWAKPESGFYSSNSEAFVIFEFWTSPTSLSYAKTNSIYSRLTSNYNVWTNYPVCYTNTASGITLMKVIIGSGQWRGGGSASVCFDDATLSIGDNMFRAAVGATVLPSRYESTNVEFMAYDGALAALSSANPLRLTFWASDESGISRSMTVNTTNMNVDVGTWLTDNVTNYYPTESSLDANTIYGGASSVWRFVTTDVATLMSARTNKVRVSVFDADADRTGDAICDTNHQMGYLVVSDDDVTAPWSASANRLRNPGFEIGGVADTRRDAWGWEWNNPDTHGGRYNQAERWPGYDRTGGGTNVGAVIWCPGCSPNKGGWWQAISNDTPVGTPWMGSAWFYRESAWTAGWITIKIELYDASSNFLTSTTNLFTLPTGDTWVQKFGTATTVANTAWIQFTAEAGNIGAAGLLRIDDASLAPVTAMRIKVGTTYLTPSDYSTNALYYVDVNQLTNISASKPLYFWLPAYDTDSGLSRGTTDQSYQMNMDIGGTGGLTTNNVANYVASNSTPDASTTLSTATNAWVWYALTMQQVSNLLNKGSSAITVTIFDNDNDWNGDRSSAIDKQFGYLVVTGGVATPVERVIYDWFEQAGGTWLNGQGGGGGWAANTWVPWSNDARYIYSNGSFPSNRWCYPDPVGNKLNFAANYNGALLHASRNYGTIFTSGKFYMSWKMNFDFPGSAGNSAYCGAYLMDGDSERAFIGKTPGSTVMGLKWLGATSDTNSQHQVTYGTGNDYLYVVCYDFSTRTLSANVYATNEMLAEEPKGYWDVSTTLNVGQITNITGMRFRGGVDSDPVNNIGNVYFDEFRAGTNWYEVVRREGETYADDMAAGPIPKLLFVGTNYTAGANNNLTITDAQLANTADKLDFAVMWSNQFGVFMTNLNGTFNIGSRNGRVNPNWDPLTLAGGATTNSLNMDTNFGGFVGANGALTVTTYVQNAFSITTSSWNDTYYISMSAENNNTNGGTIAAINGADAVPLRRAITVNSNVEFYVTDDDTNYPTMMSANKLMNPDFESGTNYWGWSDYVYLEIGENNRSGTNSVTMRSGDPASAWGCCWQTNFLASAANTYVATIQVRMQSNWFYAGNVYIKLEFRDASAALLGSNITYYYPPFSSSFSSTEWRPITCAATSPLNTARAAIVFGYNYGSNPVSSIYFDDAYVSESERPLKVMVGTRPIDPVNPSDGWTNAVYNVTDGDLATNNFTLSFRAYDTNALGQSGLARTNLPNTWSSNMSISVTTICTNNTTNYSATRSSANSKLLLSTSVWYWASVTETMITNLMSVGTNVVSATLRDADFDRAGDQLSITNQQFGRLWVTDDDTGYPEMGSWAIRSWTATSGSSGDAYSTLGAGDIYITGFTANNTDDFAFVTFVNIAPTTRVYITDRGFLGTNFIGSEGGVCWTSPPSVLPAGSMVVVYGPNASTSGAPIFVSTGTARKVAFGGSFNFAGSGAGDQLTIYQDNGITTNHIFALSTDSVTWSNSPAQPSDNGGVPPGLANGTNAIHTYQHLGSVAGVMNGRYIGPTTGSVAYIKSCMADGAYWAWDQTAGYSFAFTSTPFNVFYLTDHDMRWGTFSLTGQVRDVDSGINENGLSIGTNFSPNFDILNSVGSQVLENIVFTNRPADGAATAWAALGLTSAPPAGTSGSAPGSATNMVDLGVYHARVSIVDNDFDRTWDQLALVDSNVLEFTVVDDDTTYPQLGTYYFGSALAVNIPILVNVDGFYANLINESFYSTNLNFQWRWMCEDGCGGQVNNGLELFPTNAYRQAAIGSTHTYDWAQHGQYTYQLVLDRMFASNNMQVQFFLIGNNAGGQPTTYADYNCPNTLLLKIFDADSSSSVNWGIELWAKGNNPYAPVTNVQVAGLWTFAYITNTLIGFTINSTNVTLFATNAADGARTTTTNITSTMMNYFSTQAVVYVGGKNNNGVNNTWGDFCRIRLLQAAPAWLNTNSTYELVDGDLGYVSATNPLRLIFNVFDERSGLSRGTTDSATQMNVSVANLTTNNVANFSEGESSPLGNTAQATATNIWKWTTISATEMNNLIANPSNRISATVHDADIDRANDRLSLSNQLFGYLRVIDDDGASPTLGSSPLKVMSGGTLLSTLAGTSGTNTVYLVSDAQFTNEVANPLAFVFNVYDPSGIQRGTTPGSNMSVNIGGFATNDTSHYAAPPISTLDAIVDTATSVWRWVSAFSALQAQYVYGSIYQNTNSTTGILWQVTANVPDADNDRAGDPKWLTTNQQFGLYQLYDDDHTPPQYGSGMRPLNLLRNPSFEQAGSWTGSARFWEWDIPNWHGGTVGNYWRAGSNTGWRSHSGMYEAAIPGKWGPHPYTYGGWWQEVTNEAAVGTKWEASAWFWSDNAPPKVWTSSWRGVQIEFRDGNGGLISSNPAWFATPGETWTYVSVIATSPANTAWVRIWISAVDVATGDVGALQFDDVVLQPMTNVYFDFQIDGVSYWRSGYGTNPTFRVEDGDLAQVSQTNPMKFIFNLYDQTSTVFRTIETAYTGVNYDVGYVATLQDVYRNWASNYSSVDTTIGSCTSVFVHYTNFTRGGYYSAGFNETGEVKALMDAGDNVIGMSAPNYDFDRGYLDQEWLINQPVGHLYITDDDVNGPQCMFLFVGTAYTPGAWSTNPVTDAQMLGGIDISYLWYDYASGLWVSNNNGAISTDGNTNNISMNWDLRKPDGTQIIENQAHAMSDIHVPNGNGSLQATITVMNVAALVYTNNATGVWAVTVSAQDYDNDRGMVAIGNGTTVSLDRATASDYVMNFLVTDDDSDYPVLTSNANSRPLGVWIGTTNIAGSSATTNAVFTVTDADLTQIGGSNLLLNSEFEQGLTAWTSFDNLYPSGASESGTGAVYYLGCNGCQGGAFQDRPATAGMSYVASLRARAGTNFNADAHFKIEYMDTGFGGIAQYFCYMDQAMSTNWQTFAVTSPAAPANAAWVRATIYCLNSTSTNIDNRDAFFDEVVLKPATVNTFRLTFSAFDGTSGLNRGTEGASTQMSINVGAWVTTNGGNYVAAKSSPDSTVASSTSTWEWAMIHPADLSVLVNAGSNLVSADLMDADDDRPNDRLGYADHRYGFLKVSDDDTAAPAPSFSESAALSNFIAYADNFAPDPVSSSGTNRTYHINDEQLVHANTQALRFVFSAYDSSGISRGRDTAVTNMSISIVAFATNDVAHFVLTNSSPTTTTLGSTSVWVWLQSFSLAEINGLMWTTSKVTANIPDADTDRLLDTSWRSNYQFGFVSWIDDDAVGPYLRTFGGATSPLALYLGGKSGTNVWVPMPPELTNDAQVYRMSDGQLAGVSSSSQLMFEVWIYDTEGIARGVNPATNLSLSVGNTIVSNTANFNATLSCSFGRTKMTVYCTNYWVWTNFTFAEISRLYTNALPGSSNRISFHAWDADDDRVSDQSFTNRDTGWLVLYDDDANPPRSGIGGFTNLLFNADFEQTGSDNWHAYHWEYGNPDEHAGIWGNSCHTNWRAHSGSLAGNLPGYWGSHTADNGGWWQETTNNFGTGVVWDASVWLANDAAWTARLTQLKIEFYDYTRTNMVGGGTNTITPPGTTWQQYFVTSTSTPNAAWARFVILMENPCAVSDTALSFDDAVLRPRLAMGVQLGNNVLSMPANGFTTNATHVLSDGQMGSVSATNPLRVSFGAWDAESGLSRGTLSASTQMNITIPVLALTSVSNYYTGTPNTMTSNGYSVWEWRSLSGAQIQSLIDNGSNLVSANLYEMDFDRSNDWFSVANQRFGFLKVVDDDTNAPYASDLLIKDAYANVTNLTDQEVGVGNWSIRVWMYDDSLIPTNQTGDWWKPNYSFVNPAGVTGLASFGFESQTTSDQKWWNMWRNWAGTVDYTNVMTGTWSVVFSAEDMDSDRDADNMAVTNHGIIVNTSNKVLVIDDDQTAPTSPQNIVVTPTDWTNRNYFSVSWTPATDASGIYDYRAYSNSTPSITDGWPLAEGLVVTTPVPYTITNASWEFGNDEVLIPDWSVDTNGWTDLGNELTYGNFDLLGAGAQQGSNALRIIVSAGKNSMGGGRYSLISQYVPIYNTNNLQGIVTFNAWFKGNLSATQYGDQCAGFMKIEFCDTNHVVIQYPPVENEYSFGVPLKGVNTGGNWTNITLIATQMSAAAQVVLFSVGLENRNSELPCTGWWDNVTATIKLVSAVGTYGAVFTNAPEGAKTNWLYATDDDNDRLNDRLMSPVTNFVTYFDQTAPARVTNVVAMEGLDPASEMSISWNALPNGGGVSLSPWRTYKIFYTEDLSDPTTNSAYWSYATHPTLGTNTTGSIVISNLTFGTSYKVALAGLDRANNLGLLSSNTVVTLSGFFMTQGVLSAASEPSLFWTAATNTVGGITREYDLIYCDAMDFHEATTAAWYFLLSGYTNTITDLGATNRCAPWLMVDTMRFYRAAMHDNWLTGRTPRVASAEIYGFKTIRLWRGQNWCSLPLVPDTYTVARVFGFNLPGSTGPGSNTTYIGWYNRTNRELAKYEIYLVKSVGSTQWTFSVGGAGNANNWNIPIGEGFVIEIPQSASQPQVMRFIGKVPTNMPPTQIQGLGSFNIVGSFLPRRVHPSQMNLIECGFQGGTWSLGSDRLRKWNRQTQAADMDVWYNTTLGKWVYANGTDVPTNYFGPDDAIIIWTRKSTGYWYWTNRILYPYPNKNINP